MVNPTPLRTKLYSVACVEWTCSSANTRQNSWKQFVVAAQITGETTTASWRTALDAVQRRHPLLGVCIDADDSADPYFHLLPELRIPLQIVPGDALQGWEDKMETELSTPFPVEDALLVRAVLLHEAHRATILLTAHHSIADGLGRKTNMKTRQQRPAASFAARSKPWSSNATRPEPGSHNAQRNYQRYLELARAEALAGNTVGAENYYQHAEHYFRSMSSDRGAT
jgi:Domain of unknown function (DUF4167)/Condensation domain